MAVDDTGRLKEEKISLLPRYENLEHQTSIPTKKGGLISVPFIIVNESFEKVASFGLLPNMIFYLMNVYNVEAASGSIILSLWSFTSSTLAIVGAFLSDSYLGRFKVIALGTFASLLGTTLLWLTTIIPWMKPSPCAKHTQVCDSSTQQFLILFTSFALISIGAGCVRPCSMVFGVDQVDDKENPNNARVVDSFFNWYYASVALSGIIALTLVVYIQDQYGWFIGFGLPAFFMLLSLVVFLLGSPLYVHVEVKNNVFIGLIQVIVAAYRKRKIKLPFSNVDLHYFCEKDSIITTPSDNLRFLNKACMIMDPKSELNSNGSSLDTWSLCTIEQVEHLKSLVRLIPMWSTGIIMMVAMNQTYIALQANTMDRHITSNFQIPPSSFIVFSVITATLWIALNDRVIVPLLDRYFGLPSGLWPKLRIGIGMLLSCLAMLVGGGIESMRRKYAIDEGIEDQQEAVLDMSAMWLVPQLVLLGLAEALGVIGLIEFYYSQLPKSMSSIAIAMYTLGGAISSLVGSLVVYLVDAFSTYGGNESWLSVNLNKGHVDYYYWLIAFLGLVNFLFFSVCCRTYGPSQSHSENHNGLKEDFGY